MADTPSVDRRILAGQELRRRGALNAQQEAALAELERRAGVTPAVVAGRDTMVDTPEGAVGVEETTVATPEGQVDTIGLRAAELSQNPMETDLIRQVLEAREAGDTRAERLAIAEIAGMRQERGDVETTALGQTGRRAEAGLRGFGQGVFGFGDLSAAAGQQLRQAFGPREERLSFRENLAFQRGRRRAMQERDPVSSGVGFAGGVVSGGLGSGAVARAPGAVGTVGRALTPQAGRGVIANAPRFAATGGLAGGVTGAAESGGELDPTLRGAATGAALGPLAAGAGRGAEQLVSAAGRRLSPQLSALEAIARRVGVAPEQLAQRFDDFRAQFGRNPALAEIIDERAARELAEPIAVSRAATEQVQEFAEEAAQRRPAELGRAVAGERVRVGAPQTLERRRRSFDAFMDENAQRPVVLDEDTIDFLMEPEVRGVLPRAALGPIRRAMEESGDGVATVTLRDVDNIRQALSRAGRGPGAAARFREDAAAMRDIAEEQVPGFGQALDEFAGRSEIAEGVEMGRRVVAGAPGRTQEFVEEARMLTPEGGAGLRVGARQAIAEAAEESPVRAARTTRALAEGQGLRRRVSAALGVDEAERLQDVGEQQLRAARGVTALTPRTQSISSEEAEAVQDAIAAAVLTTGRASGAFQANVGRRILRYVGGDERRARQLAAALTDPDTAANTIARLRQLGATQREIADIVNSSAAAAGILGAPDDQ